MGLPAEPWHPSETILNTLAITLVLALTSVAAKAETPADFGQGIHADQKAGQNYRRRS